MTNEPNWSLWTEFQSLCKEKNLDPQVITYPEKFTDHLSCAKRANTLRELSAKGASLSSLTTICGLDERRIRQIISLPVSQSGNGKHFTSETNPML